MKIDKHMMAEGKRIFKRRRSQKEHHKFNGDPKEIVAKVVNKCWNGRYFQASLGNFTSFYIRDFGMSVESLIHMKYEKQVVQTVEFALNTYARYRKVTTTITPEGVPIDIFDYACDSLPYLIKSIRVARAFHIAREYIDFLNNMIDDYYKKVFDTEKNIVYENKHFSSMKDNHKRKSSMYDNCCVALLSMEIEKLKPRLNLNNPFKHWNSRKALKDRFWVGTHFLDDISRHHYISADANIVPYLFEIFNDRDMMESSINTIISEGLDSPIPAKYTKKPIKEKENKLISLFAKNYQGDTCWTNVGMLLMQVTAKRNRILLRKHIDIFLEMLEKHRNFLEVFDSDGNPYKTYFYMYDEGMLWSSIFYRILDEYYQPLKHYKVK